MQRLKKFRHIPGAHCGSTALNNLAGFYGHALTEPLCFGIGEGMGFMTFDMPGGSPTRIFMGRNPILEERFFKNLNLPFTWKVERDPARAWQAVRQAVDQEIPVLLKTDLHDLAYYHSKTHFAGHVVVLVGYDEATGKALLSDTHFKALQTVSLEDLARARRSNHGPRPLTSDYFPVEQLQIPADLGPVLKNAIVQQAKTFLAHQDLGEVRVGIEGMEHLARNFVRWREAPDWTWCARFGYQIIEKRGTGGGNFRRLYASFLEAAARWLPEQDLPTLAGQMRAIAERWTDLATTLKTVSESSTPAGFAEAGRIMEELAAREKAYYLAAASLS